MALVKNQLEVRLEAVFAAMERHGDADVVRVVRQGISDDLVTYFAEQVVTCPEKVGRMRERMELQVLPDLEKAVYRYHGVTSPASSRNGGSGRGEVEHYRQQWLGLG